MFSLLLFRTSQFRANLIPTTASYAGKYYLHLDFDEVRSPIFRAFSSIKVESGNSFTISYLINSCGLSPKDAEKASKKVNFNNSEKPNLVLSLFKERGFSQEQIAYIAKKYPDLFLCNVEKTLLPKFEFFSSIGIPANDVASKVCFDPQILTRSFEKTLMPSYNLLKSILDSDEKVAAMFKRRSWIFACSYKGGPVAPNVEFLQKIGVPKRFISLLVSNFPEALARSKAEFSSVVDEVMKMGFDISKSTFVVALHARMGKTNRKTWDRSISLYKKWGWSECEVLLAIKKYPHCMLMSEDNLMKTMEYFVNKMGLPPSIIAEYPWALSCSLEKRIKPRCFVIQILVHNGFLKKDLGFGFLIPAEKTFLKRYVKKYEEQLPNLLALYQEKLHVPEP